MTRSSLPPSTPVSSAAPGERQPPSPSAPDPGPGSTQEEDELDREPPEPPPRLLGSQLGVLVVDDDKDICDFLAGFLAHDGFQVTQVTDSTKAMDVLRGGTFHICVIDLMMPKLSGLDLLQQIRHYDDDIALVIFTGNPSLDTATASIEFEVSAYIRKPFSLDEFRAVIERIARRKGLVLRREDELHRVIGTSIRDLRKQRRLTLRQMSRRTKLSVSLLSQIERAESSASVSSLFKVATALDVSISQLFGDF